MIYKTGLYFHNLHLNFFGEVLKCIIVGIFCNTWSLLNVHIFGIPIHGCLADKLDESSTNGKYSENEMHAVRENYYWILN